MRARRGHWVLGVLLVAAATLASGAADAKGKRRGPAWLIDNDCNKQEPGAPGEPDDLEFPLYKTGLHFDLLAPPDYDRAFAEPEVVAFRVTVKNDLPEPADAFLEVTVCALEEECLSIGGDFWSISPYMLLEPGERRSIVVFTLDPLSLGKHTVSFTLLTGDGTEFADRYFGEYIQVGESRVDLSGVEIDGTTVKGRGVNKIRMSDPEVGVPMTVSVDNTGKAPEGVYAVFAINGGFEYTCGEEIYAPSRELHDAREEDARVEPIRVEPGESGITVSALWEKARPGNHTVSVLVFDQAGQLVAQQRGIAFRLK